jgi:hypothetical protein
MYRPSASSWRPTAALKYLPREVAFRKLQAMVAGAAIVHRELTVAG